jgi:hypothetical protein
MAVRRVAELAEHGSGVVRRLAGVIVAPSLLA